MKPHGEGDPGWEGEPGEVGRERMGCPGARGAGAGGPAPCPKVAVGQRTYRTQRQACPGGLCHPASLAIISAHGLSPLTPSSATTPANAGTIEVVLLQVRRGLYHVFIGFSQRGQETQ